ncbi:hypothetical protein Btru_037402 [Bulinus truncatus]|nr:hypothetical protein Btru_037402 [Bulinus truncatus]
MSTFVEPEDIGQSCTNHKFTLNLSTAFSYFFLTPPVIELGLPSNCDRRNGCQGTRYLLRSMRLRVKAFRQDLLDSLDPGEIEVTGEATPNRTSWFEVTVNGKLIHSKKNGDGFVDRNEKMQKIIQAIKEAKK